MKSCIVSSNKDAESGVNGDVGTGILSGRLSERNRRSERDRCDSSSPSPIKNSSGCSGAGGTVPAALCPRRSDRERALELSSSQPLDRSSAHERLLKLSLVSPRPPRLSDRERTLASSFSRGGTAATAAGSGGETPVTSLSSPICGTTSADTREGGGIMCGATQGPWSISLRRVSTSAASSAGEVKNNRIVSRIGLAGTGRN